MKKMNKLTNNNNNDLVCLQMADLLLVMVAAPTQLLQYFSRQSPVSGTSCKVSEYFRVLSAAASILNLTAVTLERYLAPFHVICLEFNPQKNRLPPTSV